MSRKMIAAYVLILTLFFAVAVEGGEEKVIKGGVDHQSAKCWKRQKAFEDTGNSSLCRDFEKLLNTTCEPPEKLKCNWTFPPGQKTFKKIEWETIEWRDYWGFIEDLRKSGVREDMREELWKREEINVRRTWENGLRKLQMAKQDVDIDHNGKRERLLRRVRLPGDGPCGVMYGVLQQDMKRLDWAYEGLFRNVNSCEGAEIIIYKGQAFMFGWDYGWKIVMAWQGFDATGKGSLNVCQFKYIKGGSK